MTDEPIRIARKELSSEEILEHLDTGNRVIVTAEVFGVKKEVALRKADEEYVCDTGFKLLTYSERDGLKRCIERLRLSDGE